MRRGLIMLSLMLLSLLFLPAAALADVSVFVNNNPVKLDSAPIFDSNSNRILVPFRQVFQALGAQVSFDENTNTTTAVKGTNTIKLVVGQSTADLNGNQITLSTSSRLENGCIYVPLQFINQALDCNITPTGNGNDLTVYIDNKAPVIRNLTCLAQTYAKTNYILKFTVNNGLNDVTSQVQDHANQIIVDLENTKNQLKNGFQLLGNNIVSSVKITQPNDTTTRLTIQTKVPVKFATSQEGTDFTLALTQDTTGGQSSSSNTGTSTATATPPASVQQTSPAPAPAASSVVVPPPVAPANTGQLIIIDPGHGGEDVGAIGVSGRYEKDLVLSIALKLRDALVAKGYQVLMTRSDDTFVSLEGRTDMANATNAPVFVSIHANTCATPSVSGVEIYHMYNTDPTLANDIHDYLLAATGQNDRNVREAGFWVIKYTNMPAVLVETGYISNSDEENFLWDPNNQTKIAAGIANGIAHYLGN